MTEADYSRKLDELDRLLNDPDVALEPARVWALMAEVSGREAAAATQNAATQNAGRQ